MGRGIQAEIWSGSRRLRDAKADVEGFVRLVQERYQNEGGGDLDSVGTPTLGVHVECGLLDSKHGRVGVPVPTK